MTPFVDLVVEALNLMHPRFARANGADSFRLEFYHAFRRLWDKALPVKLGLGHVMLHDEPAGDASGLYFWRLGEGGQPDAPLGVVVFSEAAVEGYPHVVRVGIGTAPAPAEGETAIAFDTERWAARVL